MIIAIFSIVCNWQDKLQNTFLRESSIFSSSICSVNVGYLCTDFYWNNLLNHGSPFTPNRGCVWMRRTRQCGEVPLTSSTFGLRHISTSPASRGLRHHHRTYLHAFLWRGLVIKVGANDPNAVGVNLVVLNQTRGRLASVVRHCQELRRKLGKLNSQFQGKAIICLPFSMS